jgi:predicted ferric reductase
LWLTDWPFSTYLVLHRWVSRIFAVQAIVHSITLLLTYKGTGSYATESKEAYWLWGIVATVLTCAMLVLSHLYFRRLSYEFFLGLHIVLAILVIIGCWYHVVLMWGHNFYLNWLYAATAIWLFDRLARVLRMIKNGVLRSVVTELDSEFIRIDIPGVRWASKPGHVAYAYFPTLHPLRPWENHPFSINSTTLFRGHDKHTLKSRSPSSGNPSLDGHDIGLDSKGLEAISSVVHEASPAPVITGTSGVTLILKKKQGLTKLLEEDNDLITLLDGPYPQSSSSGILECDRVLLIGGGIGITGLTAWIFAHPNVKLAWSIKRTAEALVKEMTGVTSNLEDKEIVVGGRLDVEGLLKHEAGAGYEKVGVVVCGPGAMCDSVRAIVAGLGRSEKTVFELEVDAFGW